MPGISPRSTLILLAGLLASTLTASAQLHIGPNVQMSGAASINAGYNEDSGTEGSDHGLGISGQAVINGFYYNPNFLSFQATPFYNRSQTNSDSASLTNTSGTSGSVTLFGGSKTPGSITYYLDENKSGTFGVPGMAGLTTASNDHGFNVNWSALYPGLPPLMVSFNDSSGSSSVIGTPGESDSNSKSLSLGTHYKLRGFGLSSALSWMSTNTNVDQIISAAQPAVASKSTSTNFTFDLQHRLPMRGSFNAEYMHMGYSDGDGSGGSTSGSSSTVSTSADVHPVSRLSISGNAEYTNNIEGGLEQQLINSTGQVVPLSSSSSSAAQFGTNAFLHVAGEMYITGFANHGVQSYAGKLIQTTNYGVTTNYAFQHTLLRGLTVNGGVIDSATQEGNEGASLVGNVNYARHMGPWTIGGGWSYSQNVETLVNVTTTSSMGYNASAQRKFAHQRVFDFRFNGGHTGFTDLKGYLSHTENYSAYYFMGAVNVSGNYSKSYGQSILTSSGLVNLPVQLPSGAVSANDLVSYGGSGYGFGAGTLLFKRLSVSVGYNHNDANTSGLAVNSIFTGSTENARLHYRLRKIILDVGYSRLLQDAQSTLNTHTAINSFFVGFSRTFNLF